MIWPMNYLDHGFLGISAVS